MRGRIAPVLVALAVMPGAIGAQSSAELSVLGHAALERRDPRVAVEHFTAGLELDPADYAANWGMALALLQLGSDFPQDGKSPRRDALYGRYWGASEEVPFLHFELSYYRAIELAIARGLASVQAGAQGEHKLARGYEPVITSSLHFIPDPGFRAAVAHFVAREREAVASEME